MAGDLFWYPVEGDPTVRLAPDVLVAEARPKGPRSSYLQWLEGGPPSVVFEVWSPGNSFAEQVRKLNFYDRHGVDEFIGIRPETGDASVFIRRDGALEPIAAEGWVSRLGIRFEKRADGLCALGSDGKVFWSEAEIAEAAARADAEAARADAEAERADAEANRADAEANRAARLAQRLRAMGIDPDAA